MCFNNVFKSGFSFFRMIRKRLLVIIMILVILALILWFIVFQMSFTGRAIQYQEEQLLQEFTIPNQNPDFSTGLPQLSPSILPSDKLIQGLSEEDLACEEQRTIKRAFCSRFAEEYPNGCPWYAALTTRRCIILRDLCLEAQTETQRLCTTP